MRWCAPLFGAAMLFANPTQADMFRLGFPLDCTIGETCFVEDYVDHDPTKGKQTDFNCGLNSRDGHKGTDFALLSFDEINTGVAVLAAADGVVFRTRDEMPDDRLMRGVTSQNACGNAVIMTHADGWRTQYCHLKLGSITVQPGETVEQGQVLGFVGLSGQTNHPHLHFSLYQGKVLVDPFQTGPLGQCEASDTSLWQEPIPYTKTGIMTAGFSDHIPDLKEVRDGNAFRETSAASQPLVVYMHAAYAQHGDLLTLSAQGPEGEIFEREIVLKSPQASHLRAFGRKAPAGGWPKGEYLGEALLTRKGKVIAHRFAHVTVN